MKSTDEAGNPILLAENRLMLTLSYLLQSNHNILSGIDVHDIVDDVYEMVDDVHVI